MKKILHRCAAALALIAVVASALFWAGATPALAAAPPAPGAPVVTPSPTTTDGTVVLTWNAPASGDIAYYQIFRFNGTGTPAANDATYIGQTDDATRTYVDQIPTEGPFRYAVMAVDADGNAGPASTWTQVTADFPGNGSGTITRDATAPSPVTNLKADAAYTKDQTVNLTWTESTASDLWRYLIYRKKGSATPEMIGYVAAGESATTDIVTADGTYQYFVKSQDQTGNVSSNSGNVSVVVDTTAPTVAITSPVAGRTYTGSGTLAITATITENGSGYSTGNVKYYLDNDQLDSASITLTGLAAGAHTAKVEVTDRAGNKGSNQVQFIVGQVTVDPAAPRNLAAPAYSKSRTFSLTWAAPQTGAASVAQYLIYRAETGEEPSLVGTTLPNTLTYQDTVEADGTYSYYVTALAGTSLTPNSNTVVVNVDTVAPSITVSAPKAGQTYAKTGTLTVQKSIADAGGYDAAQVKMFLDGTAFTGTQINLANLTIGNHTFKVDVTDRAGNAASKTVEFAVNTTGTGGDEDDDEDEDDDQGQPNASLIDLLTSLQSKIHHGHYVSLMAKLKAGKIREFTLHVIKHRGKFIAPDAADKLLEAVGAEDLNINPNSIKDSDVEGWNKHSNGKGKGGKW